MATRVTTPAEALAAMAGGERSGVDVLIRQGAAAIPAVVAQYAKTRGAVGRAAACAGARGGAAGLFLARRRAPRARALRSRSDARAGRPRCDPCSQHCPLHRGCLSAVL